MIDLLGCFRKKDHSIRLNKEFHRDLQWWHQFLVDWHGVNFWLFPGNTPTAGVEVSSDAAGSLGFGAYLEGESSPLLIRNSFQWSSLLMFGTTFGASGMFYFDRTTTV